MQCPDCQGYRHEGPCDDLHTAYMDAFEALLLYQDRHPIGHRTVQQMQELTRLESVCGMAKMRYERAEERRYRV